MKIKFFLASLAQHDNLFLACRLVQNVSSSIYVSFNVRCVIL